MITLTATLATLRTVRADMAACFLPEDAEFFAKTTALLRSTLGAAAAPLDISPFTGKPGETLLLYPAGLKTRRLLLVGLGKAEHLSMERLRRAAATARKAAAEGRAANLALLEPDPHLLQRRITGLENASWDAVAMALAEGAVLDAYRFDRYFTGEKKKRPPLAAVSIVVGDRERLAPAAAGVRRAAAVCEAVYLARDLANAPGSEVYPESLAARAAGAGRRARFRVRILTPPQLRKLGMGGVLGVGKGSRRPPRFIVMEHGPARRAKHTVVLVGKGVTFDSGGISIKPSANMAEMRMDMSGAAAVIGTMQAAARLRLPVRVVGLVPTVENMPGGNALKPGDILTHLNGKTSEVDNTDAEGRLILADALSYASRFKPDVVIDLATLTGACVVALGHHASGMMGNDEPMMERLRAAGERSFERVWPLPLFEEYEKQIKSDVADVKNVGGRWAGAITAGLFLKNFIGDYRWIHLDIAGTAILEEDHPYAPKGASGVGVRLLTEFLQALAEA